MSSRQLFSNTLQATLFQLRQLCESSRPPDTINLPDPAPFSDDELLHFALTLISALPPEPSAPSVLPVGTPWQLQVWGAICSVPLGETRAYSYLAEVLRCPSGSRAVANACAANTQALVVPCHRIVPKDGSLGGYRWGPRWKAALIEAEKRLVAA